jgi:hypothetical protein
MEPQASSADAIVSPLLRVRLVPGLTTILRQDTYFKLLENTETMSLPQSSLELKALEQFDRLVETRELFWTEVIPRYVSSSPFNVSAKMFTQVSQTY